MKKAFKLITLMLMLFISIYFYNYNNSIIEIETEVKGKLSTQPEIQNCLHNKLYGTMRNIHFSEDGKDISSGAKVEQTGNEVGSFSTGAIYKAFYDTGDDDKHIYKISVAIYEYSNGEENEYATCSFEYNAGQTYHGVTYPTSGVSAAGIEFSFGLEAKKYGTKDLRVYVTFWYSYVDIFGKQKYGSKGYDNKKVKFRSNPPAFVDGYIAPKAEYNTDTGNLCFSTRMKETVKGNFKFDARKYAFDETDRYTGSYENVNTNFTVSNTSLSDGTMELKACSNSSIDKSKVYWIKFSDIEDNYGYELKNESDWGRYIHPELLKEHTTTASVPTTSFDYEMPTEKGKTTVDYTADKQLAPGFGFNIGTATVKCEGDGGIAELIDDFINIIFIIAPILTILMGTIDFMKALISNDADALQKASSNMIKRAIALVLLLFLKVILLTIFNFFGINMCI